MQNLKSFIFLAALAFVSTYAAAQETGVFDLTGVYSQRIQDLAGSSPCAKYTWKNRGRAPAGYVKGVALSFARSLCRTLADDGSRGLPAILSAADSGSDAHDALTHYRAQFSALQIRTDVAGQEALRALYILGMGLGMRESSGAYCEGWDTSAGSRRPSSAGEAGLYQTSYDSIGASPELAKLYAEYRATPQRCNLNVFKQGASCRPQSVLGTGAGAEFQTFNKACPAFAADYAMTLLRILRSHFGPINRREAELRPECNVLLQSVEAVVNADVQHACEELF